MHIERARFVARTRHDHRRQHDLFSKTGNRIAPRNTQHGTNYDEYRVLPLYLSQVRRQIVSHTGFAVNHVELDKASQDAYLRYIPFVYGAEAGPDSRRASTVSHVSSDQSVVRGVGFVTAENDKFSGEFKDFIRGFREAHYAAPGVGQPAEKSGNSDTEHSAAKTRSITLSTAEKLSSRANASGQADYRKIRVPTGIALDGLDAKETEVLAKALEIDTKSSTLDIKRKITRALDKCNSMLFGSMGWSPYDYKHGNVPYSIMSASRLAEELKRDYPGVLSPEDMVTLKDAARHLHLKIGCRANLGRITAIALFFDGSSNFRDHSQNTGTLLRFGGPSYEKAIALADVLAKLAYAPGRHRLTIDFISGISLGGGVAQAVKARLTSTTLKGEANDVRRSTRPPPMILFDPQLLNQKQVKMAGPPAAGVAFTLNSREKPRKTLMARMKGLGGFNRAALVEVQLPLRQDDGLKARWKNRETGKYVSDGLAARLKHALSPDYRRRHELRLETVEYTQTYSTTKPRSMFLYGYHRELLQYERCLYRFLHPVHAEQAGFKSTA